MGCTLERIVELVGSIELELVGSNFELVGIELEHCCIRILILIRTFLRSKVL